MDFVELDIANFDSLLLFMKIYIDIVSEDTPFLHILLYQYIITFSK